MLDADLRLARRILWGQKSIWFFIQMSSAHQNLHVPNVMLLWVRQAEIIQYLHKIRRLFWIWPPSWIWAEYNLAPYPDLCGISNTTLGPYFMISAPLKWFIVHEKPPTHKEKTFENRWDVVLIETFILKLIIFYHHTEQYFHPFTGLLMIRRDSTYKGTISCLYTSSGLLSAESWVKPTMSLKNIVTELKLSGATELPCFNWSATDLVKNIEIQMLKLLRNKDPKGF